MGKRTDTLSSSPPESSSLRESASLRESPSPSELPVLSELPTDELAAYGCGLGLSVDAQTPRGELLRLIRERHELLLDMDHDAMLDVVVWARLPVRRSASKEQLARRIAEVSKVRFDGLSDRGVRALARLRGIAFTDGADRRNVEKHLRRQAGLWSHMRRTRRSWAAALVSRFLEGSESGDNEYRFLPENGAQVTLKKDIEDAGVVGGIARKLRGVADEYVEKKLDEIERRIDRKLDEIDKRLAEWRDREMTNRLRIIKFTLITAVIVAAVSLGYDYAKKRGLEPNTQPAARLGQQSDDAGR